MGIETARSACERLACVFYKSGAAYGIVRDSMGWRSRRPAASGDRSNAPQRHWRHAVVPVAMEDVRSTFSSRRSVRLLSHMLTGLSLAAHSHHVPKVSWREKRGICERGRCSSHAHVRPSTRRSWLGSGTATRSPAPRATCATPSYWPTRCALTGPPRPAHRLPVPSCAESPPAGNAMPIQALSCSSRAPGRSPAALPWCDGHRSCAVLGRLDGGLDPLPSARGHRLPARGEPRALHRTSPNHQQHRISRPDWN